MLDNLIQDFLGNDILRPAFSHPHEINGKVYASDKYICLISPAGNFSKKYLTPDGEKVPGFIELREKLEPTMPPITLNRAKLEEVLAALPKAPKQRECEECLGVGEVECEYGHDHDCPNCKGTGVAGQVIGEWYHKDATVRLGGATFKANYVDTMLKVADELGQDVQIIKESYNQPNVFKIGDTEVWIAPRTDTGRHHVSYEYRQLEAC